MENKKILILGATGQIGKELSLKLKETEKFKATFHGRTPGSVSVDKYNKLPYVIRNLNDKEVISQISS